MAELPTGTVTFFFTDIEGSTRMLQALGERWRGVVEDHNRLLRDAIREADGLALRTEGDAVRAVWDEGYAMTPEQAVEYARREI